MFFKSTTYAGRARSTTSWSYAAPLFALCASCALCAFFTLSGCAPHQGSQATPNAAGPASAFVSLDSPVTSDDAQASTVRLESKPAGGLSSVCSGVVVGYHAPTETLSIVTAAQCDVPQKIGFGSDGEKDACTDNKIVKKDHPQYIKGKNLAQPHTNVALVFAHCKLPGGPHRGIRGFQCTLCRKHSVGVDHFFCERGRYKIAPSRGSVGRIFGSCFSGSTRFKVRDFCRAKGNAPQSLAAQATCEPFRENFL